MKKLAIIQSNYLPWRGYFDIIHDVDLFLFYDEVQYTNREFRHRNVIYTNQGLQWLTLPGGRHTRDFKISEVQLNNATNWQQEHFNKITNAYRKAPFFAKYKPFFEHIYMERRWQYLSELNQFLTKHIATEFLGIKTAFANSTDYPSHGQKGEKLLSLIKSAGYAHYLSGPAAKDYLDEAEFAANGVSVYWKDYSGYPEYPQVKPPFEPQVSIIDLLVHTGDDAPQYIWGWRDKNTENRG
ncbi:MAG: WbqC family protein [Defluviitaleaceae bacterium]|nr:WbqC family protein [Defluviitaleaceae bacterium]